VSRKVWIYIGVAFVAALYLYSRRANPSNSGAGGNAVGTAANADMGGASFGSTDPTVGW
jgi:hypothetical protein